MRRHEEEDAHRRLAAEGRLHERVDHKNDQDDGEKNRVDVYCGKR